MAYNRSVSHFKINGQTYNLMTISDYTQFTYEQTRSGYQWLPNTSGLVHPNWISDLGNKMQDMVGYTSGQATEGIIENYEIPDSSDNAKLVRKYGVRSNIDEFDLVSINIAGAYISQEPNIQYYLGILLDDTNQFGCILTIYNSPDTNLTKGYYAGNSSIYNIFKSEATTKVTSNGGGATHIAKVTGQLKDLSSNLSDILMVSGGGGGGLIVGDTDYSGKEAGGISGSGDNSADQTTGNAFGLGESGTNLSGGGSGLYGGYKGTSAKSGGAGSGYIGNSLLSNKKMVGYNVPTSSAESTKTESVNVYSASGESNKPKAGDGKVKIKLIKEYEYKYFDNLMATTDLTHIVEKPIGYGAHFNEWSSSFSTDLGSDYILRGYRPNSASALIYNSANKQFSLSYLGGNTGYAFPLNKKYKIRKIKFEYQAISKSGSTPSFGFELYENDGSTQLFSRLLKLMPSNASETDNIEIYDNDWHTAEFSVNITDAFYVYFWAYGEEANFRNIQFMVEKIDGGECI